MVKAVVTGAGGYIGSVLTKRLRSNWPFSNSSTSIICVDDKPTKYCPRPAIRYADEWWTNSFDDPEFVQHIVKEDVDVIYHLAASSLLGPSATDPIQYYWNNTARTINLVKQLTELGWKGHIVFSSTAAVYGVTDAAVTETSLISPPNNYGASKLMCEQVLRKACMYGIDVTVFRYFNVSGADGDVGQDQDEPHILTRICNAAAGLNPEVNVFGEDYPTPDGTCIRDYVHVMDICRAQIWAHDMPRQTGFRVYNLGTKTGTSVKEIIDEFEAVTGIDIKRVSVGRREGDPPFLVADPTKFIDDTGFMYMYSDKNYIIKSAWEYFKERYNGI